MEEFTFHGDDPTACETTEGETIEAVLAEFARWMFSDHLLPESPDEWAQYLREQSAIVWDTEDKRMVRAIQFMDREDSRLPVMVAVNLFNGEMEFTTVEQHEAG